MWPMNVTLHYVIIKLIENNIIMKYCSAVEKSLFFRYKKTCPQKNVTVN